MSEFTDIPREIQVSDLPAGETILWRGKPDWRFLAIDAFHAPLIALYFGLIGTWQLVAALHDGARLSAALLAASGVVFPAIVALSLVSLLAWLSARATVFTLTDRRVVMRYGMALPALINIPLGNIEAMRMRKGFGGTGDVAFTLPRKGRLAFHQLWPYARPWRLFPADPMLRAVPNPAEIGAMLASALRAAAALQERQLADVAAERPILAPGKAEPVAQPASVGAAPAGAAAAAA